MTKKNSKLPFLFIFLGFIIMLSTIYYVIYYSVKHKTTNISPITSKVNDKAKDTHSEVLLTFSGDSTIGNDSHFAFANSLPSVLQKNNNNFSYFYKNVSNIFKNDDITITNLETTFTNSNTRSIKKFNFKADPSYAKALTLGSIEGVNISNNHIYDYKKQGFKDTISTLENNKINYFGEGNIWIKNIKGVNFGFLGYTGFYNSKDLQAKIKKDIEALKKKNCVVIINFHWGAERNYHPLSNQIKLAHFAIDNGADLIIGHHPHVIQGIETYKNKVICYSLGNFCFGGNFNPKDKDTFIFQVNYKFKDSKMTSYSIKAIPCSISSVSYINNYCPTPSKGSEKTRILKKLNSISTNSNFKISDKFYDFHVKN